MSSNNISNTLEFKYVKNFLGGYNAKGLATVKHSYVSWLHLSIASRSLVVVSNGVAGIDYTT